jgi:MtN3 and saliva related transmembrane protein
MIFMIGMAGAILTTSAFLPQVIKAHQTRHTKDLSFAMYFLFSLGLVFWLIYGCVLGEMPIILANGVTLVMAVYILILKIKYG